MNELQGSNTDAHIFATKKLTDDQLQRFQNGIKVKSEDFIKISPTRLSPAILSEERQNVVITSQNAVEALLTNVTADQLKFKNIYCVGRKTKRLIEKRIGKVAHSEKNAQKLAQYLAEYMEGLEVTYFCSNLRLDELPAHLTENNITVHEIEAYKTKYAPVVIDDSVRGVLFFSPSGIESYLRENNTDKVAYCIGETTAKVAREHFSKVKVAKIPTVDSVVDLVNEHAKDL